MLASALASAIGSSEGAIKLLLTIFIGYPLALLYRTKPIYTSSPSTKHILFLIIGLLIGYYNFGLGVLHTIANITIVYLALAFLGPTRSSVGFVFVFNTAYLIIGYYYQISKQYGISWTMPHCVLTLRLTAVAFDYYDGRKKSISKDQEETALQKCPSLLEMLGHTFYFGGYMVGPQFSLKRYLAFVNGEFSNSKTGETPGSTSAGLEKLGVGLLYIIIYQCLCLYIPDQYLNAPEFYNSSLLYKCALILLWGKNALHKYIGVWLMQEGVIILTGLSYNGLDDKGHPKWNGCTNIYVKELELGHTFAHFISSFNVNTNQWMSRYIFKRLRFLGSKMVSQLLTLFYLALWHGLQSGYYMCFFLELIYTNAEKKLDSAIKVVISKGLIPDWKFLEYVHILGRKLLLLFLWSYALVPFCLHDLDKWVPVYRNTYYLGFVIPLLGASLCHLTILALPHKHQSNGVTHTGDGLAKSGQTDSNEKKEL